MLDVKKAYEIVKANNPKMKAYTCTENDDIYSFSLVPEDLKDGDGFANSAVYTVNKNTGEYNVCSFWAVVGKPIIRTIDVSVFD